MGLENKKNYDVILMPYFGDVIWWRH